jgi:hypothetical protein
MAVIRQFCERYSGSILLISTLSRKLRDSLSEQNIIMEGHTAWGKNLRSFSNDPQGISVMANPADWSGADSAVAVDALKKAPDAIEAGDICDRVVAESESGAEG